jgi:hypothetical protein
VLCIPDGFEHAVREAQAEQIEHGGATEEVVDAVDLVLGHEAGELGVEGLGALDIGAEGLLERECQTRRPGDLLERCAGGDGDRGRQGEVDRGCRIARVDELLQHGRVGDVGLDVGGRGARVVATRPRAVHGVEGRIDDLLEVVVAPVGAADADQLQLALVLLVEQLAESGKEQAGGEVSRGSENDQR